MLQVASGQSHKSRYLRSYEELHLSCLTISLRLSVHPKQASSSSSSLALGLPRFTFCQGSTLRRNAHVWDSNNAQTYILADKPALPPWLQYVTISCYSMLQVGLGVLHAFAIKPIQSAGAAARPLCCLQTAVCISAAARYCSRSTGRQHARSKTGTEESTPIAKGHDSGCGRSSLTRPNKGLLQGFRPQHASPCYVAMKALTSTWQFLTGRRDNAHYSNSGSLKHYAFHGQRYFVGLEHANCEQPVLSITRRGPREIRH